jgi:hypothetical protein
MPTMNAYWAPFVAVATVFVVAAGGTAWWSSRRTIADLRRRLVDSENSRREMAEQLLLLRRQVEAGAPPVAADDVAQRREALERALDTGNRAAPELPWLETMPGDTLNGPGFAKTQPNLDLDLEEAAR